MRVLLVGSVADRARLRERLDRAFEIAGEFQTLSSARSSAVTVDAILMAPGRPGDEDLTEGLTAREIQVLELLSEGLSNKAIAGRLGISDQTVKFHVAAISARVGRRSAVCACGRARPSPLKAHRSDRQSAAEWAPAQRSAAHDAARHGVLEAVRVADCHDHLSGLESSRVTEGQARCSAAAFTHPRTRP